VNLELAKEEARRPTCRICGLETDRVCTKCGIDIETGDLVAPPAETPEGPQRDGTRPERREALREQIVAPETLREIIERGLHQGTRGILGTGVGVVLALFALSFQRVPWTNQPIPWPGQLGATFVVAFLIVEHARAAREGEGGKFGTSGVFDPTVLGSTFVSAFCIFPILAGPFASEWWIGLCAGLPFALAFPALVGALVCDGFRELLPSNLKDAFLRSPNYAKTTLVVIVALCTALAPIWLLPDGAAGWRAPLCAFAAAFAGALIGLLRRDGETQLED
jgi:hypothetical protein